MKNSRLHIALSLLAAVLTIAWLPARAQAQFSFVLDSTTLSALPGTTGLTFSGTLTNSGATKLNFGGAGFNLLTGPGTPGYLATFPIFLDNFFGPDSLAPGQTITGNIFSLDIDPNALLGTYTGNFLVQYGSPIPGKDVTINVGPPQVPEAGTLPILALGMAYSGYVLFAARRRRAAAPR